MPLSEYQWTPLLPHHIINCLHTQVGVGRRCLPTAIHPRMDIYMVLIRLRLWLNLNHLPLKVNLCMNFTSHTPTSSLEAEQHILANSRSHQFDEGNKNVLVESLWKMQLKSHRRNENTSTEPAHHKSLLDPQHTVVTMRAPVLLFSPGSLVGNIMTTMIKVTSSENPQLNSGAPTRLWGSHKWSWWTQMQSSSTQLQNQRAWVLVVQGWWATDRGD